jgi:PAS domain S-box-containing protein
MKEDSAMSDDGDGQRVSILMVEDDASFACLIREVLEEHGYLVETVGSGREAADRLASATPTLMLVDYSLSDMTADRLLDDLAQKGLPVPPFIVSTGAGDERIAVNMMKRGARDYLVKDSQFLEALPQVMEKVLRVLDTEEQLRRAQFKIRESEEYYRKLFDVLPDGVAEVDLEGRLRFASPRLLKIFGIPPDKPPLGRSIFDWIAPELAEIARSRVGGLASGNYTMGWQEYELVREEGSRFPGEICSNLLLDPAGAPHGMLSVVRDMTERKMLEKERSALEVQLLQSQKMESLGMLAGGIAHDFNNILMLIIGNADLAMAEMPRESASAEYLLEVEMAARRASELCRQLLAYAGKGHITALQVDLNVLIREMGKILELSAGRRAVLETNLAASVPMVEADASQVRQIILNLVTNSAEAMPETGGRIKLSTGSMNCTGSFLASNWFKEDEVADGDYVFVEVTDNGLGIEPGTLSRMFDPFFTTKFMGRGLGLASVLGVVKRHKGAVKVMSRKGQGTTFQVFFPVVPAPIDSQKN